MQLLDFSKALELEISYINNVYSEYIGTNALIRMYDRINMNEIFKLIDEINIISNIRKNFYKEVIKGKYKQILTVAYKKLNK